MYYPDLTAVDIARAAERAGLEGAATEMAPGSYIGAVLHDGYAYVVSGETNTLARTTEPEWRAYVADHEGYVDATGCDSWEWVEDIDADAAEALDVRDIATIADALTAYRPTSAAYTVRSLSDGEVIAERTFPAGAEHTAHAYFDSSVSRWQRTDLSAEVTVQMSDASGDVLAETTVTA